MKKIKLASCLLSLIGMTSFSFASTVGNEVIADLKAKSFDATKSVWSVTQIESVNDIGIYQVPFFNGNQNLVTPMSSNLPPAVALATQYQALIATAESSVDIASLDSQNSLTLDAIRDGLTQLDQKGKPIEVRIIFGTVPDIFNMSTNNKPLSTQKTMQYITSKLGTTSKLKIYVGTYRAGNRFRSWNHAKILAVDSKSVITGGVNFLDSGYASQVNPVNDLSLYYPNMGLALPANKFLDNEWAYLCKFRASAYDVKNSNGVIDLTIWRDGRILTNEPCPKDLGNKYTFVSNHEFESNTNADYAISTGRLGAVADWKQDTSDVAIISLIDNANSTVKISQQAVYNNGLSWYDWIGTGGQASFPDRVLKSLCGAIARGVSVELMTSGEKGEATAYPSYIIWPKSPVYPSYASAKDLKGYLVSYGKCRLEDVSNPSKLQIKVNGNKVNPNASVNDYQYFPNHSKVVIVDSKNPATGLVDGKLVYVGSHNTYDQSHAEYGVIVDSKEFVDRLEDQFWNYNWNSAK